MRQWRKIGGTIYKWTEERQELTGTFQGFREGKFGDLGVLEDEDEHRITFAVHANLQRQLEEVKPGQFIRIIYEGFKLGNKGHNFKAFSVEVAEDDGVDWPLPNAPDEGEPEEELPS